MGCGTVTSHSEVTMTWLGVLCVCVCVCQSLCLCLRLCCIDERRERNEFIYAVTHFRRRRRAIFNIYMRLNRWKTVGKSQALHFHRVAFDMIMQSA